MGGAWRAALRRLTAVVVLVALLQVQDARAEGPQDGCVVVTGATGFAAGHVVEILLGKGYTVHGTVRSVKDTGKTQFLRDLDDRLPGTLKLFEADIGSDNAFDEASKGCWGIIHLAAVILPGIGPQKQVDLAVNSAISVLEASKKYNFKAVTLTSSVAAVCPDKERLEKRGWKNYGLSTHEDWNTLATLNYGTYPFSKVQMEQAAQQWMKDQPSKPFRLAIINFPFALGPQQNTRVTSSNSIVNIFMNGEIPFVLPMHFNLIDVRDVAKAHVEVTESTKADGRYIVAYDPAESSITQRFILETISDKFPAFPVPFFSLPFWLFRIVMYFDGRMETYMVDSFARGTHPGYDGSRLINELGFKYDHTNAKQTIIDTAQSMIDLGIANTSNNAATMQRLMFLALPVGPAILLLVIGPGDGCVVVSGATGYAAGHVVKLLLDRGYTVHGTVRSVKDATKTEFLWKMADSSRGSLKLFEADIGSPDAFEQAAPGCWGIIHLAAPILPGLPHQEQVQLAVQSGIQVLETAKKHKLKAVTLTSSTAAVGPDKERLEKRGWENYGLSTHEDWNTLATLDYGTYSFSKVKMEKAAQQWMKDQPNKPFRLAFINFPFAIGPQQNTRVTSSNKIIKVFMNGEIPFVLPMFFNLIDVRDVAKAHVEVTESTKADGRYIVAYDPAKSSITQRFILETISAKFPAFAVPRLALPFWLFRLFMLIDGRIEPYMVDKFALGPHPGYDGSRLVNEIGFVYDHTDPKQSILDAAQSMIDLGIADPDAPATTHPLVFVVPAAALLVSLMVARCVCCRSRAHKAKQA
ncbi:Cinnamoyl-CoA reductase 1 (PhCCR1) (Coniferylaldehyde synthase) [Durusdinium trenchii]|uniref:Cinnamoyl-CoA reductase 1 (PhCCR1) (Coniferylaldehyde synthase) n=1 Tax=Durusdinium trenchii TaxID=1381693 RepID=A0ABP0RER3_9DINO